MLHDRHLYTVHKVPVRFQRCLACMVAKQGPCGDHKATWLCRSRLTDAPPGVDVQNGISWLSHLSDTAGRRIIRSASSYSAFYLGQTRSSIGPWAVLLPLPHC